MKRWISISAALTLLCGLVLVGCDSPPEDPWNGTTKPRVVTTFAPIHCFALNVCGDDAEVRGILSSQGPHHADPPLSHARLISKSNIFFANGLHVDDTIVKRLAQTSGKGGPAIVKLGNDLPKDVLIEGACPCCKDEDDSHDHTGHKSFDGHVWLGIQQADMMTTLISQQMQVLGKDHTNDYIRREREFHDKLQKLHADGKALLKDKKERTILPFHASLAYFAKSFDLKLMDPIMDVPGSEPTGKHMQDLADKCAKENVRIIAVEPQYGAGTSARTMKEMLEKRGVKDVQIIVIDPLETAIESEFGPNWYEKKMRQNLDTLSKTLR